MLNMILEELEFYFNCLFIDLVNKEERLEPVIKNVGVATSQRKIILTPLEKT